MTKLNNIQRDDTQRDESVLIVAPVGRDAAMMARFLTEAGIGSQVCASVEVLCDAMQRACGLIFLTGEALTPEATRCLTEHLALQPAWSDIPLVVLISGGAETPANADTLAALSRAGDVTLIERPVRGTTLLSAIRSALRARHRQYDVRDHLAEEVRAKQALSRSEEQLHIALDAAQLGAWQFDFTTSSLECTALCKANFGFAPEAELTYEVLLSAIHPDDRELTRAAIAGALREQQDYRGEYRVVWPDASLHWILASGRANYGENGQPYNMSGVTLDITERKAAEQEREQLLAREQVARSEAEAAHAEAEAARAEAETASRLKDEFLATVSHELRTPLTAILGWSSMLRTGQLEPGMMQTGLETIERNARSQVQLINDLLDVSRIITGKLRLELRAIDAIEVIEAAIEAVRPSANAKSIDFRVRLDAQAGSIAGDAERLQQVVWNLLNNAVKFTPNGGTIQVSAEREDSHLQITIRDSGKGIPAEFLSLIFDRFRQADQTSTRSYGGLGLGLSIVRQLVHLHGGMVDAHSDGEGKGATFIVRLPLLTEDVPQAHSEQTVSSGEVLDGLQLLAHLLDDLQVLVVDDESDTRDVLCAVLERCGANVTTAASAAEAIEVLAGWKPDILISDIGMPEEDGCSLIGKVRALEAKAGGQLPAIALTAYVRPEDEARALKAGFQVHVSKPVEPQELVTVVARLTGRSEA
jgi:PAS domain S-box-containing protein